MYRIFVCLRYLRKKKITFFAIAGVAVGVMALIVVHAGDVEGQVRGD